MRVIVVFKGIIMIPVVEVLVKVSGVFKGVFMIPGVV